ncbi:hypothetical protein PQX77_003523 [Marasmius sp. AFHP31]|nr:hypothetical protein PQX77_003523 [Marasmius sp. AFHP31]
MAPTHPSTIRRYSNLQTEPSKLGLYYSTGVYSGVYAISVPTGDPAPAIARFMNSRRKSDRLVSRRMIQWGTGQLYTIWFFDQNDGNGFPPNSYLEERAKMAEGRRANSWQGPLLAIPDAEGYWTKKRFDRRVCL